MGSNEALSRQRTAAAEVILFFDEGAPVATTNQQRRQQSSIPNYVPSRRAAVDQPTVTPDMMIERCMDFLKRRGPLACTLALLAGILTGVVAWMNIPLVYTARRDVNLSPPDHELAEFKETQIKKLISPVVCKVAVNLPEARELSFVQNSADPAEALSKWIEYDTTPLARSFSVMISDPDPKVAQTLVNCVVKGFLQHVQEEKSQSIQGEIKIAEEDRDQNNKEIERIKAQQLELAGKAGYGDPQSLRKRVDELEAQRRDIERNRSAAEFARLSEEKDLEALMDSPVQLTPEQEQSLNSSSATDNLDRALSQIETTAEEIRRNSINGDQDADYIRYRRFIDSQRSGKSGKEGMRERYLAAARTQREQQVRKMQGHIQSLAQQETLISRKLESIRTEIEKIQSFNHRIEAFRLDLGSKEVGVERANARLAALRQSAQQTNVFSPTEADEPKIPKSSSKRLLAIFGGAVGAFLAVLSLFAYADLQVNLITRPEHLEKTQPLPVLGILPKLPTGRRIPTDDDFEMGSKYRSVWLSMNEAVNSLRVMLTFAPDRHNDGMSTLMVTSPRDAEGKSTFAAHLAICLARSGVKVCLVEADMHRPTQFETFGATREPGLSDVLLKKVALAEAIQETDYPSLFILPAGSPVDERTQTLVPERLQDLFTELRTKFQTVIVDAPPVLPVYDAMVLGQQVDQTVLMVRCDHSRFQTIDQARQRLESVGVPIAGLVVSGTNMASRYGYYYESYARSAPKAPSKMGASMNGSAAKGVEKLNGQHHEPSSNGTV
jgi:capsular exopolysaccharide synthesis family protein